MRHGDRVQDHEGRTGTVCVSRLSGEVSIEWDDTGMNEHYVEWEFIEPIDTPTE